MEKPPDGYIVFCKRACETCATVVPALKEIAEVIAELTIYCQDDPGFPEGLPGVVDDTALETSFHFDIETVPTLIRMEDGRETGRAVGWDRAAWRTLTGMECLGGDLPEFRPGCGAKNVEPGIAEELAVRFGKVPLASRRIESPQLEDDSPWEPISVERGFDKDVSTVTLFAGDGVQAVFDQLSRTPESLAD